MSDQENLLYEVKRCVAIITINRPDKAHAFTIEMLISLYEMLSKADEDEKVKCIIIKSTGEKLGGISCLKNKKQCVNAA